MNMVNNIIKTLANLPLGYEDDRKFVRAQARQGQQWQEAGVLVLLAKNKGEFSFILNKRSQNVSQPGDLCWPGGHPKFFSDRLMASLIIPHILPMGKDPGFIAAKKRSPKTFNLISYYLANALRECWEEIGVGPRRVEFLGALPCYRLLGRQKLVYPMAGFLRRPASLKTSHEIEKNVLLPMASLFSTNRYGTYSLILTGKFKELAGTDTWDAPCFAVKQKNGPDEILWGATFMILMSFMNTVFGFKPPENGPIKASAELYPSQA